MRPDEAKLFQTVSSTLKRLRDPNRGKKRIPDKVVARNKCGGEHARDKIKRGLKVSPRSGVDLVYALLAIIPTTRLKKHLWHRNNSNKQTYLE